MSTGCPLRLCTNLSLHLRAIASLLTAFFTLMGGLYLETLTYSTQATSACVIVLNAMLLAWFAWCFLQIFSHRGDLLIVDSEGRTRRMSDVPATLGSAPSVARSPDTSPVQLDPAPVPWTAGGRRASHSAVVVPSDIPLNLGAALGRDAAADGVLAFVDPPSAPSRAAEPFPSPSAPFGPVVENAMKDDRNLSMELPHVPVVGFASASSGIGHRPPRLSLQSPPRASRPIGASREGGSLEAFAQDSHVTVASPGPGAGTVGRRLSCPPQPLPHDVAIPSALPPLRMRRMVPGTLTREGTFCIVKPAGLSTDADSHKGDQEMEDVPGDSD